MQTQGQESQLIPTLDGWRAIAIVMVLVAHYGPLHNENYDIGRHGVGIFFVLSGYLITSILLRERERTGAIDLRAFYTRRFFRLMPVAWTLLVLCFAFRAIDLRELLACVFFYRNFLTHGTTIVAHFWSLSVEEQFYLAWPWAVVFLTPRRARDLAIVSACAMAAYRFWFPPLAPQDPRTWFRADALLIGCVFALEPRIPKMPAVAFWTALGAVGACAHFVPSGPPLWESALIGWMIYTTAQGGIQIAQKVLNWEPLAALGVMSYSLYVWQTPLSGIPHRTFLGMAGAIVILAAFTILSHNYIEQPARRFGLKVLAGRSATTGVVAPPKVKLPEAVHVSQSRVMSG